jgi:fermentation-respiration switch protein FrsA (DUF1100 family)
MATIIAVVVIPYLALVTAAWFFQRHLIYLPSGDVPPAASVGLPRVESVSFTTEDGLNLAGWFVPAADPRAGHTVIVFNGNAGNRAYRAPLASALARQGIATLLFDYRGFGGNPGTPSEEGLSRDARAALDYVVSRPDVDRDRIVYFGESLGAGVAIRLASERKPAALIVRSPFASLVSVARRHYPFLPVRWLLRERYPSDELIRRMTCPTLVITGGYDSIVPVEESRKLYDAAPEPKQLLRIEGADHNDFELLAGPRLVEAIVGFLRISPR